MAIRFIPRSIASDAKSQDDGDGGLKRIAMQCKDECAIWKAPCRSNGMVRVTQVSNRA